jgi:hypothetical protein
MAEQIEDRADEAIAPARRRRLGWRIFAFFVAILAGLAAYGWLSREEMAGNLIESQLGKLGVDATYRIEEIGPRRQVVSNIVVGDPVHPDLTIERVEVTLTPRFPLPGIGRVTLVKPRLYGTYRSGKLSFGSLDKVLFEQPSTEPFTFPNMELSLVDARALMESDFGPIGAKAQGSGHLQGGFAGILAVNAPKLAFDGCAATDATLFGNVTIDAERPGFAGPLRLASLDCPGSGLTLRNAGLNLDARVDRNLAGLEGNAGLVGGVLTLAENRVETLAGSSSFSWRKNALTAKYTLSTGQVKTPNAVLGSFAIDGSARSQRGLDRVEIEMDAEGSGLRIGPEMDKALASFAAATSETLVGPMLAQVRATLAREGRDSDFSANLTLRKTGDVISMVVPQARLRGGRSGETLFAVSRFQYSSSGETPRFSGGFTTGGTGMPQISGRMELRGGSSNGVLNLRMAEYHVKDGSLSVPELVVTQTQGGMFGFAGSVVASGPLPGGSARNLVVPVSGNWSEAQGLSVWRKCTGLSFDALTLASLTLEKRSLQLCPPTGAAILRSDARGTKIAAGTPSLDIAGRLGETPILLRTGAVGLAWPGNLSANDIDVTLGPQETATRFQLSELEAKIDSEVRGNFSGADARIFAVPLDILDASGEWRFADGRLDLTEGAFRLEDREQLDRFEPLTAQGAELSLENNRITADAVMREPASDRVITSVQIAHSLETGTGHADLDVAGIVFDDRLQPDTLTGLALGIIANANGTVRGSGMIDWNETEVTSTGHFSTSDFNFAAAFGPVEGVSGTIDFTDLLGMVTAPNQRLRIRSFNPGIQVDEGELVYELHRDYLLVIHHGEWPFIGGMLHLDPTRTRLAEAEARRYTLRLEGVDAAQFVQRMELANIAATGLFDGSVPLVFDENGGRIEQGRLLSRPPGGNLSYVGELTYKDLSAMANFAFDALRALDYREMEILLDGSLTGEIVTKVRFDGIRQGEQAKRNIITKQLAKLPIRFNVNIRAPFYKLITALHAMYDPAYVRDPRDLGLLDASGRPVSNPVIPPLPALKPEDQPTDEAPIQPPESEPVP